MNTNPPLTDLWVIFSNGTNKYAQLGCVITSNGWELKQAGTFRSDYDERQFANADEFKAAIEKYLKKSGICISRLVIDGQSLHYKSDDNFGQGIARGALLSLLTKVN